MDREKVAQAKARMEKAREQFDLYATFAIVKVAYDGKVDEDQRLKCREAMDEYSNAVDAYWQFIRSS